jgi:hypothetical protein
MRKILGIDEVEFRQQGAYPDKLRHVGIFLGQSAIGGSIDG